MRRILFTLLLLTHFICFSQAEIKGFILDSTTKKALPYAAIILGNSRFYTITNEDGLFEINRRVTVDSLEVRYLGYESKKVPISYFGKNLKLYLTPSVSKLQEVIVVANANRNSGNSRNRAYATGLLKKIIKKYRKKNAATKSKAYVSLTSSAKNIPIEQIEGFYTGTQSLSGGLTRLRIKSGRFGQNKSLPFYSLNNTKILENFQFFKISGQILPRYPGTMLSASIENDYLINIDGCTSCAPEDVIISFVPKKRNRRLFSGKMYVDREKLILKKMELHIKEPLTNGLISIIEDDTVTPKEIRLNIGFNPLDYSKIQYLDMNFTMLYRSKVFTELIETHSFIYFYELDGSFNEPYFTKPVHFNNDYDKMIAFQATDDFWETNFQYPKSVSENRSTEYLKKFGYLINYDNSIPAVDVQHTKTNVILWNKDKPLSWESIKSLNKHTGENEVSGAIETHRLLEKLSFTYLVDSYQTKGGQAEFIIRTLFDRNASYYNGTRTKYALDYVNLTFDIYEYNRQIMQSLITKGMTFSEVKKMSKRTFKEATKMTKNMKKITHQGTSIESLKDWKKLIGSQLDDR